MKVVLVRRYVVLTIFLVALAAEARAEHTSVGHVVGGFMITGTCLALVAPDERYRYAELKRPVWLSKIPPQVCWLIPTTMAFIKENYIDDSQSSSREDIREWTYGAGAAILWDWKFKF